MTLLVDLISPRDAAERKNLCIKAINKVIGVAILFRTSRLLAHSAPAKENFLTVTGVRRLCLASSLIEEVLLT